MKVIDFSKTNSILNQYISEIRNVEVQNDRLRFRRNIERIGEIMAYEMSKEFTYSVKNIRTPLGVAPVSTPDNNLVISTILRAGLPFHQGFLSYFDGAENAFVSAYRKYKDTLKFDIHIEYIASPRIDDKNADHHRPYVGNRRQYGTELSGNADQRSPCRNPRCFHHRQPEGYRSYYKCIPRR